MNDSDFFLNDDDSHILVETMKKIIRFGGRDLGTEADMAFRNIAISMAKALTTLRKKVTS